MYQGISVAVMTTTVAENGCPDYEAQALQTEKIASSSMKALFPCASTGEFPCFTHAENDELLAVTAKANRGRKLLYAGIADSSLDGAIKHMEIAKKLGYDACVANPPYYYPMSQKDVFGFYKALNDASEGMSVIAYHAPFFTTGIESDTFERILELENVKGMKDSSANCKRIGHLCSISASRKDFCMYTGTDDILAGALLLGCGGSMTALGASMPEAISAIYEAFEGKRLDDAIELQRKLMPVLRQADRLPFPAGYKLLAEKTLGLPRGKYLQVFSKELFLDVEKQITMRLEEFGQ